MEDSEEGLDEWKDLMMSSKGLFSDFAPENCGSKSFDEFFNGEEGSFGCDGLEKAVENSLKFDNESNSLMWDDNTSVMKTGVNIAERRAIKCGYNASKIRTSRFRCSSVPSPNGPCSSYVAVSSGISPHTLLESPMLLPNSQLSPTTGTFASCPINGDGQMLILASSLDVDKGSDGGSSALFKPHTDVDSQPCDSNIVSCLQMPHENGPSMGDDSGTHDSLDGDQNGPHTHTGTARTAEDGYNWRKYGQKQVKGSEYPRSYYKCTHPNCSVKKKVERSHDGQITEIIYKGAHNHPKPQSCRKSTLGSLPFNETSDAGDGSGSVWRRIQSGHKDNIGSEWRIDGFEKTSPTSAVTEGSDPLSTTQGKAMGVESAGTPEFSSTLASHEDDEEDLATQGGFLSGHNGDNEPDLKRRKKDGCFAETTLGSRAVREPRVVVQIESDIDILDDGYRWRKYGQKVVKGNPNPRSYYKCTTPGCTVRKHVERSSQSLKFVLTTYEGKHNHDVPAARNSGHVNSGSGSLPAAATNTQTALALPRNSHLPKPDAHAQDLPLHFDTKIDCSNDILRSNFMCNLGAGTPFYPMKFPALPNTTPYGSFGLSTNHPAYASNILPTIPELSLPLPLGFPPSIANYHNPKRSHSSVQSLYAGQQLNERDVKLLRPKKELRDDSFETDMNNIDQKNTSSSVYNHIMGNFRS